MLLTIYTILMVLILFGITIFVHELGHYLTARWCGMVIETFSIGFGPALWKRKVNGIVYKIGVIPFGGYVALPQMDPGGTEEKREDGQMLPPVAPWKKIIVAAAGAIGNMLLAFLIAYVVYWAGKPSAPHERNCVIGYISTNSAVFKQGLALGDEITAVNGEPVRNWEDLLMKSALATQVTLNVRAPAGGKTAVVATEKNWMGVRAVAGIGWMNICSVASVVPGSSAAEAGLKSGDRILEFNGKKLYSREHLIEMVNLARDQTVPAVIRRGKTDLTVQMRPKYDAKAGRALIGIIFNTMDMDYDSVVHPKPMAQIRDHATVIVRFLRALLTPKEAKAASQAVGGPIAILFMFWLTIQNSFILALWFTCMLNVNLAILNMLPVPVLDGGHICFSLWELITRRRVPARVVNITVNVFATLLIGLFLLLTYRDVMRWVVPLFPGKDRAAHAVVATNSLPTATNAAPAVSTNVMP